MNKKIEKILSEITVDNNVIYVLKGFNSIINKLNIQLPHIFDMKIDENILNLLKEDKQFINNEYAKLLQGKESFYCLYEEMKLVESKYNIPQLTDYKIALINFNCFDYFYPGIICEENEEAVELFNQETDNGLQKVYSEFEIRNGCPIIVYNLLDTIEYSEINMINSYTEEYENIKNDNAKERVLYDNSRPEVFIQVFNDVFLRDYNCILYTEIEGKNDASIKKYLSILNQFGVNIKKRIEEKKYDKPDLYEEYLKILKRKNENYNFKNIPMYKDPFRSNEMILLNQRIIIDSIYQNMIKAKNSESFKDIFVTAPTGAGKSILFQIPAIMGAEKNNLVTIVISPLIGLMKDQVNNIGDMTNCAETINSEYTPMQKEEIIEKIKSGEKSILYISPEALLSNSDIKAYIGERDIGLLVVDEAHTVATWGKNFRPDYWYLGEYLDKLRRKSKYIFPIATFTATATISNGLNDMYHDIVESLNMTCEAFFGKVKRDDIKFDIRVKVKDHAYREEKEETVYDAVQKYVNSKDKTIVYFPYVRFINEIYEKLPNKNKVGRYFGNLDKFDKDETLEAIRFGNKNVVLATKAFGMGIDVKDIKNVYHFAPTGNLADYVQEIGRAARDENVKGTASMDYFEEDFGYINKLYGMSKITNYNIICVLRKIEDIYKKKNRRNFMVSVDEFSHAFKDDDENIENRLKATIIAIKKDFKAMSSFKPLIFKPRSMFTKGLFWITNKDYLIIKNKGWDKYLEKRFNQAELKKLLDDPTGNSVDLGNVYEFDFKKCWEENYNGKYTGITFGEFKWRFFEDKLEEINKKIFKDVSLLTIDVKRDKNFEYQANQFFTFLDILKNALDDMKMSNKHYTINEMINMIYKKDSRLTPNRIKNAMEPLLTLLISYDTNKHGFGYKFCEYNKSTDRYHIKNANYDRNICEIKDAIRKFTKGYENEKTRKKIVEISKDSNQMRSNPLLIGIQMMELMDMITYIFELGNRPEFFVRVNSEKTIKKVIENNKYQSATLSMVSKMHYDSVRYMKYFFERLHTDEDRWNFIEDYFLGNVEDKYNIPKDVKTNIKKFDEEIEADDDTTDNIVTVYSIYDDEDNITKKYYVSDDNIKKLDEQGYINLKKDTLLAQKLIKAKTQDVIDINGYGYLLEKIEHYDV